MSETLVSEDFLKLIALADEEHEASDLEIYIKNSQDKPVCRLYSYLALMQVRLPKLAAQAVDTNVRSGNRPH
jgi:hypothetical protein